MWITGLSGSGKSVIARATADLLRARRMPVKVLELDVIRKVVTLAPRYTAAERDIVYPALGHMAVLLAEAGVPVIVDATGHRRVWRDLVRAAVARFAEVQLVCPLELCQERECRRMGGHASRDVYAQARRPGATVPGVNLEYEPALAPELVVRDGRRVRVGGGRTRRRAGRAPAGVSSADGGHPGPRPCAS